MKETVPPALSIAAGSPPLRAVTVDRTEQVHLGPRRGLVEPVSDVLVQGRVECRDLGAGLLRNTRRGRGEVFGGRCRGGQVDLVGIGQHRGRVVALGAPRLGVLLPQRPVGPGVLAQRPFVGLRGRHRLVLEVAGRRHQRRHGLRLGGRQREGLDADPPHRQERHPVAAPARRPATPHLRARPRPGSGPGPRCRRRTRPRAGRTPRPPPGWCCPAAARRGAESARRHPGSARPRPSPRSAPRLGPARRCAGPAAAGPG